MYIAKKVVQVIESASSTGGCYLVGNTRDDNDGVAGTLLWQSSVTLTP